MPSSVYNINFKRVVKWNTPFPLRKTFWLTFLGVLILPVVQLYQSFLLYRKAKLYDLMITSQICYMEAMLNDRYDNTQRRIYIVDGIEMPPLYMYQDDELHPIWLYTDAESHVDLYTDGEGANYANDFIIMVPNDVVFTTIEMRSLVKRKRLPGMRFTIQTF